MSVPLMHNLYSNSERYNASFTKFLASSDEHKAVTEWIEVYMSKHCSVAGKGESTRQPFKMLSLGGGSGEVDIKILKELEMSGQFQRIKSTVVEPCTERLEKYKSRVSREGMADSMAGGYSQFTFKWYNDGCQNFKAKKRGNYDLIHMIQMLYYVTDVNSTVLSFYTDLLRPGGSLWIIHVSENSAWQKIWERFGSELPRSDSCNYTTGKDVQAILTRNNLNYEKYEIASRFEISQCFVEGSSEGRLLLDFITETDDFTSTAPKKLQEEMLVYLRDEQCSYKSSGKTFLKNDLTAFVIKKPLLTSDAKEEEEEEEGEEEVDD